MDLDVFIRGLSTSTSQLNIYFIGFILFLMAWDFFTFVNNKGLNHRSFRNEVVTVGIFGTFFGILLGLYNFNVDDISGSIPPLLEGMKLAFVTSIAGMLSSLAITIVQKAFPSPYSKTGNPLNDKLSDQTRLLKEFLDESKKTNEAIIEQVKNHRIESKDELTKVRDSLDQTLEKLSEGATKEIIQALEMVITDFNNNLTEQFGENFKQLNDACLKLVEWQQRYIESIEQTEKTLSEAVNSLEKTSESVSNIANRNKEFEEFCDRTTLTLNTMKNMLDDNIAIQEQLRESINSLKTVSNDLERIPQAFESITTVMDENNKKTIESLEQTNTKLEAYIKSSSDSVNNLNAKMNEATKNLNDSLVSLTNQFGDNYRNFLEQIEQLMVRNNR